MVILYHEVWNVFSFWSTHCQPQKFERLEKEFRRVHHQWNHILWTPNENHPRKHSLKFVLCKLLRPISWSRKSRDRSRRWSCDVGEKGRGSSSPDVNPECNECEYRFSSEGSRTMCERNKDFSLVGLWLLLVMFSPHRTKLVLTQRPNEIHSLEIVVSRQ